MVRTMTNLLVAGMLAAPDLRAVLAGEPVRDTSWIELLLAALDDATEALDRDG
jgi:hypothetical protein